jgi:hypothetical protein
VKRGSIGAESTEEMTIIAGDRITLPMINRTFRTGYVLCLRFHINTISEVSTKVNFRKMSLRIPNVRPTMRACVGKPREIQPLSAGMESTRIDATASSLKVDNVFCQV